jgi:hypothetical protein
MASENVEVPDGQRDTYVLEDSRMDRMMDLASLNVCCTPVVSQLLSQALV